MRETLLPRLRDLQTAFGREPEGFLNGSYFGWPFQVSFPEDELQRSRQVEDKQAAAWIQQMEQLFFAQLRLPFTKPNSPENTRLYESIALHLHWTDDDLTAFSKFALELPSLGASKIPGLMPDCRYPKVFKTEDGELLGQRYETEDTMYGSIFIRDKGVLFSVEEEMWPSGMITATNVVDKATAHENVLWYTAVQSVRYVDLAPDGGLTYIQADNPWERTKKITYADVSHLLRPKLGRLYRQLWLRVPNGIPGTPLGRRTLEAAMRYAFQVA
jgi:hypothetical protein